MSLQKKLAPNGAVRLTGHPFRRSIEEIRPDSTRRTVNVKYKNTGTIWLRSELGKCTTSLRFHLIMGESRRVRWFILRASGKLRLISFLPSGHLPAFPISSRPEHGCALLPKVPGLHWLACLVAYKRQP